IEGTFNISPSNKKILVQVEDSSLNNIEDGCAEILSDLAIDKGVSLEPWEITCLVQTVKLSKLKIRKEAAEAKGKLKIKVKGVASFEVDGDMKEKKFSYKKGCEIIKKKARIDDYYVAFGDSITFGSDDDIMADGFGYPPVLDDLLENYTGFIHTIVNAGIPGEKSIDGLARVQSLINSHPQATIFLILFGTNDSRALGTVPVPSGLKYYGLDPGDPGYGELLDPGDPGYDGSFLDNMQQIIDAIVASGKTPILAKVPFAFGPCGGGCEPFTDPDSASRNILIQDYNTVINALVADNGISVTPPDFYEHFRANPEEFNDNIHPDGTGYQSMADLWFDALLP
nr:SGNH/GDSL hydrolase family protein [Desulfobacterales bacterium]